MENAANTAENAPRTLGQSFAVERERQGLSRADVAQRLHMSAWQVEALETGDYARLPKGTFLRGFVRNYAKVLGMPADSVMSLLPEGAPAEKKPGIVVPTQNIRFDPLGERLSNPYVKAFTLAGVAVLLLAAGMYWWVFVRPAPASSNAKKPPAVVQNVTPQLAPSTFPPPPDPQPAVIAAPLAPPKAEPARPEAKKAEPPKVEPPKVEAPKAEPPKTEPPKAIVARPGDRLLRFRFKGESWVEIRDSRGRLVYSKLNPAGSEAEIAAAPPLTVIVGNAPEVQLFTNDREFNLEPHTKVAVARFTVE